MIRKNRQLVIPILFLATQVLPALALVRLAKRFDPLWVLIYVLLISGATAFLYWQDKRKAQLQKWRFREATLHLFELLGGWASAFWAQRLLRHKNKKLSYQIVFWMIAALHQFVAYDYLSGWKRVGWVQDIVRAALW